MSQEYPMSPTDTLLDIDPYLGAPMTLRAAMPAQACPHAPALKCTAFGGLRIEFYDRSFVNEPGYQPYGQFIGSLCAQDLAQGTSNGPLILKSSVPQWWVDADTLQRVRAWVGRQCHSHSA